MTRTRRALGLVLLAGSVGCGAAAAVAEVAARAGVKAHEVAPLGTPVLSVRRVPSLLAAPRVEDQLRADLASWAAAAPPRSCAVVVDPAGEVVLDLQGDDSLVPASAQKLLTAVAALLTVGPDERVGDEPLAAIVGRVLAESDDAAAELLTAELGGPAGVRSHLARAGLDLAGVDLVDASGHSRENRITCAALVAALRLPATRDGVEGALAVAGERGTLADRFVGTPLTGHLRGKTGSLRDVAALAGIVEDADGTFTFAYVVNAEPSGRVDEAAAIAAQQRLGQILLDWPTGLRVALLGPLAAPDR